VSAKDRVFVLGKEIPKDFRIDKNNSNQHESTSKNGIVTKEVKNEDQGKATSSHGTHQAKDYYGIRNSLAIENQNQSSLPSFGGTKKFEGDKSGQSISSEIESSIMMEGGSDSTP